MSRSVIVCGPGGCGKTFNAEALRGLFRLRAIFDGWTPGEEFPTEGHLVLTNASVEEARTAARGADVVRFDTALRRMKMAIVSAERDGK